MPFGDMLWASAPGSWHSYGMMLRSPLTLSCRVQATSPSGSSSASSGVWYAPHLMCTYGHSGSNAIFCVGTTKSAVSACKTEVQMMVLSTRM